MAAMVALWMWAIKGNNSLWLACCVRKEVRERQFVMENPHLLAVTFEIYLFSFWLKSLHDFIK